MKKKIGEIYNKPIIDGDINLKTPNEIHKSELIGGGSNSGSEVKEWYYRVYFSEESLSMYGLIILMHMKSFIINHELGNSQYKNIELYATDGITTIEKDSSKLIAIKISDNYPTTTIKNENDKHYPIEIYGDVYDRSLTLLKVFNPEITLEAIKKGFSELLYEITEEEYKNLIEVPSVIIGK